MVNLNIFPPHILAEWLTNTERDFNLILLDLQGDLDRKIWTVRMNVVFKTVEFSKTKATSKTNLQVGCSEANIFIRCNDAIVTCLTNDEKIATETTMTKTVAQNSSVSISPKFEIKAPKTKVSAKLGEINFSKGTNIQLQTSFKSQERVLTALALTDSITWNIVLPRGSFAVRDFLFGNYWFEAAVK